MSVVQLSGFFGRPELDDVRSRALTFGCRTWSPPEPTAAAPTDRGPAHRYRQSVHHTKPAGAGTDGRRSCAVAGPGARREETRPVPVCPEVRAVDEMQNIAERENSA